MKEPVRELWLSEDHMPLNGHAMLADLRRLDRAIETRRTREYAGAAAVLVAFSTAALLAQTRIGQLSAALVVLSTVIILVVSMFQEGPRQADPGLPSRDFISEGLRLYRNRIKRLARQRHWCSVPAVTGLALYVGGEYRVVTVVSMMLLLSATIGGALLLSWLLDRDLLRQLREERAILQRLKESWSE